MHADQTHGINDLRSFLLIVDVKLNVYADKFTSKYLISVFLYF